MRQIAPWTCTCAFNTSSPKEAAGGYFVYEADDLNAAIELAARILAARHNGAIEIRPVATYR